MIKLCCRLLFFVFITTPAIAATEVRVLKDDLACTDYGILVKYHKYLKQGDNVAANKFATAAISFGNCVIMKVGEKLFAESVCGSASWLAGRHYTVQVRRKGNLGEYCIGDTSISSEWNPDVSR